MVMDRKACRAAIHGVAKSRTWLSGWTELNWQQVLHRQVFLQFLPFPSNYVSDQRTDLTGKWIATPFSRGSSLTQGLNSGLLHCRQILCHLSHQGSGGWESAGWHCLGTLSEPWFLSCVPQPTSAVWCQALHCWLIPMAQLPLATFIKDVSPGVLLERGHIAKGGLSSRILTLTKGFKFGFWKFYLQRYANRAKRRKRSSALNFCQTLVPCP